MLKLSDGRWNSACDSYGKVQHSRKYDCVYTVSKGTGGDRILTLAARIENHADAKVMAAAKQLYHALKAMNHVQDGYCICPRNDGMLPDSAHSSACEDARKALRKAESDWADPDCPEAQAEWMRSC